KMSSSRHRNKRKVPMGVDTPQEADTEEIRRISRLHFGFEGMEAYYLSFKERQAITIEARFDVNSFKADFPDIHNQFHIQNWEPFTMPLDPCFSELMI
ncbi:hypothetical protein HAX54_013354, partial [Datura stramonium]|nr:hypothetical protein [Datura stramonium]